MSDLPIQFYPSRPFSFLSTGSFIPSSFFSNEPFLLFVPFISVCFLLKQQFTTNPFSLFFLLLIFSYFSMFSIPIDSSSFSFFSLPVFLFYFLICLYNPRHIHFSLDHLPFISSYWSHLKLITLIILIAPTFFHLIFC